MGAQHFVLRIEGVNFHRTVFDTQDLSTIRGGSLALLNAPAAIETMLRDRLPAAQIETIYTGASEAAFHVQAEQTVSEIEQAVNKIQTDIKNAGVHAKESDIDAVLPHLSIVIDVAVAEGGQQDQLNGALQSATAKNRWRQMQSYGGAMPALAGSKSTEPCAIDRTRPAETRIWVPRGFTPENAAERPQHRGKSEDILVSSSVARRRRYGRDARQRFYARELDEDGSDLLQFTESFAETVAAAPDNIPLPLHNKMAVIYFDGNKFGLIREEAGGSPQVLREFSHCLRRLRAHELLKPIIRWFMTTARHHDRATWSWAGVHTRDDEETPRVRFETLLWGGDELIWVAPAWLAWWLVEAVFAATHGWTFKGRRLTHAGGIVLCNVKTPIRQAVALAKELADSGKSTLPNDADQQKNVCQIVALENVEIPEGHIADYRQRMFGVGPAEPDAATAFTLSGAKFAEFTDLLLRIQEHFPRSQLYRLLQNASTAAVLGQHSDHEDVQTIRRELGDYLERSGSPLSTEDFDALARYMGGGQRPLLSLALLAEYWDYVQPITRSPLPRLGKGDGA